MHLAEDVAEDIGHDRDMWLQRHRAAESLGKTTTNQHKETKEGMGGIERRDAV
jgi:hypothetical protein